MNALRRFVGEQMHPVRALWTAGERPRAVQRLLTSAQFYVLLYACLWAANFGSRLVLAYDTLESEYHTAEERTWRCAHNEVLRLEMSDRCEAAAALVARPLWRSVFVLTWAESTLCGGSSCWTRLFGEFTTWNLATNGVVIAVVLYVLYRVLELVQLLLVRADTGLQEWHVQRLLHANNRRGPTIEELPSTTKRRQALVS